MPHFLQSIDRRDDLLAELGMGLDQRALVGGEPPRLREDLARDPDLADVVQQRAELEPLQAALVELQLVADAKRRSVIQRACVDVYSSLASSAFASASTVETNVCSRPS